MTGPGASDRGVSEVLGFVLVFALIVMTIGVVYASGFSGLYHAQQNEQLQNMERAFDVFDNNIDDISERGAPNRATEIKLAEGSLEFRDPVRVTVYAENSADSSENVTFSMTTEPIAFVRDDTAIVFDQGGVIRSQRAGSAMVAEPRWIVDSQRVLLPFVETHRTGEYQSLPGGRTVLVVASRQSRGMAGSFDPAAGVVVNVTIETDTPDAWNQYLRSEGFTITTDKAGLVAGEVTTGTLYVPRTKIDVEFRH